MLSLYKFFFSYHFSRLFLFSFWQFAHNRSAANKSKAARQNRMKKKEKTKEAFHMVNRSSNKTAVPEAKSAMDRFKFEVASELGVPLSDGYNGNLTSKQNGSVGGEMVRKMIENQERQMSGNSQSQMGSGMSGQ